jgi:hypothetical protein
MDVSRDSIFMQDIFMSFLYNSTTKKFWIYC